MDVHCVAWWFPGCLGVLHGMDKLLVTWVCYSKVFAVSGISVVVVAAAVASSSSSSISSVFVPSAVCMRKLSL